MPKNTQKTNTSSTSTFGQIHPQSNQYIDAFANYRPQLDPTIGYRAGASKRRLDQSFINPLGGYSTPQRDEAIRRSAERGIDEQVAMQMRGGQFDVNQQRMGQLGSLASLMSPRIVEQSRTGQSNTEAGKNMFGNILDVGMGAASMALF